MPNNLTVTGALSLTGGLLRTTATTASTTPATLTLPEDASLSGEAPGCYVQGSLRVVRASGSGVLDFGHGATLDRTGLSQVAVTRTAGLLTDNVSRGVNRGTPSKKGIARIWTVETTTAPTTPVAVTLQWLPDDDNGLRGFGPLWGCAWPRQTSASQCQPYLVAGAVR